jgi:hypothetical protein
MVTTKEFHRSLPNTRIKSYSRLAVFGITPWKRFDDTRVRIPLGSVAITPTAFSDPAGFASAPTEADTMDMKNNGFQSRSCTLRIAWAENFGIAAISSASAPVACRLII